MSASKVTESFGKIQKSSIEQAAAIKQIKQGLFQISTVVQTNAATAEENSATSEEMSAQAAALRGEVGKFKLTEVMGLSSMRLTRSRKQNLSPVWVFYRKNIDFHPSQGFPLSVFYLFLCRIIKNDF